MARKRRNSQTELNFDGLTDSVTNLVGAMILLVVLLIGLTKRAVPDQPPHAANSATQQTDVGEMNQLLLQVESLMVAIQQTDQEIKDLEAEVPQLRAQVETLFEEAGVEPTGG